jgi:hypothetical protein
MQPDREIEVGDAEYVDLDRMGLLVKPSQSSAPPSPSAAAPASPVPGKSSSKESQS